MKQLLIVWRLSLFILFICFLSVVTQAASPEMNKSVFNMAGNTSTSNSHSLFTSIGEAIIGQFNGEAVFQAGYFNEFIVPVPTATVTPTITATLIPTATPLQDFDGKIIAKKYTYFAPNPARGRYFNFVVHVKQACEVECKLYTTSNRFVLSYQLTCPSPGKYEHREYVGNLANGVYLLLVKAKSDNGTKERLIKKLALIK